MTSAEEMLDDATITDSTVTFRALVFTLFGADVPFFHSSVFVNWRAIASSM